MASFELTVQFAANDVQQVNAAEQQVTIVKEVGGNAGSSVVWIALSPFENNQIDWEEEYGLYASTTSVQNGATITKSAAVNPASSGVIYPFESGAFSSPQGSLSSPNDYGVKNLSPSGLTFGLAQSVTVNSDPFEANPLNAVTVLTQQQATFTAIEKLSVFLHSQFNNGVVISDILGPPLQVDFTHDPIQTIHYDPTQGKFVLGPLT